MSPATERPVLYGLSRSVYTRIARLTLEEKRVDYSLVEVEIFGAAGVPPEHYARHPFGRVPTFAHGDLALYETAAITRYIDEAFTGPSLQPSSPQPRARMNQAIGLLDAYAYRPMIWDVGVQRISIPREGGTTDETIVARALPVIATCLQALEQLLGDRRFLAHDQLSLADLHAAPMLIYFSVTPEGSRMLAQHAALSDWLTRMRSRPSVPRPVHAGADSQLVGAMKQAIVVNEALKLPRGKLAAQVAHASVAALLEAAASARRDWIAVGMPKVVLRCDSEEQLMALREAAKRAGIPAALIKDAGHTVVAPGTVTCLGLGPATIPELDALTGELKLI